MSTKSTILICWREPRWSYNPRWRRFASALLWNRFWLLADFATGLAAAGVNLWFRGKYPDLRQNPPWEDAVVSGLVLHFTLALIVALFFAFPVRLRVSSGGLDHAWGGSVIKIPRADIRSLTICTADPHRPTLTIASRGRRGRIVTRTRGIAPHIDLHGLRKVIDELSPSAPA